VTTNTVVDTSCTTNCYAIRIVDSTSQNNYLANNRISGPSAAYPATITDSGTGTIYGNQTTTANQILQSSSSLIRANASTTLTGTANPTASTTLNGTASSTYFLSELQVGDRITINGETRTVTAIASNTQLTVDTAFTDTADASITRLPAALVVRNSASTNTLTISDIGQATFRNSTNSTTAFQVQNSAGTSVLSVDTTNSRVGISNNSPANKLNINTPYTAVSGADMVVTASDDSTIPLVIQVAANPNVNAFQVQSSSGNTFAGISGNGRLFTGTTAPFSNAQNSKYGCFIYGASIATSRWPDCRFNAISNKWRFCVIRI
jgi:hypothetical protein